MMPGLTAMSESLKIIKKVNREIRKVSKYYENKEKST